jgi:hypothetical protein
MGEGHKHRGATQMSSCDEEAGNEVDPQEPAPPRVRQLAPVVRQRPTGAMLTT